MKVGLKAAMMAELKVVMMVVMMVEKTALILAA